ncbi:LON peptidase substrate-binding domain-containing protein [Allohahella marinimesophila]|uniref:LON peptidase substrate-binding domain-containing protein n=1 Tax=Allohahella marinimesophila TaxID=1054972 RepID=A0ABP7NGK6_9GAMM
MPDRSESQSAQTGHQMEVPLFPLGTILCPGGQLPLRIFEQRYLKMISDCLKHEMGFVIVLTRTDAESGFFDLGTYGRISDFQQLQDGLLGITVQGREKVRIKSFRQDDTGLFIGEVATMPPEPEVAVGDDYAELVTLLRDLQKHPAVKRLDLDIDYDDCREVGYRLLELLPLRNEDKQYLLSLQRPAYRLEQMRYMLHAIVEHGEES